MPMSQANALGLYKHCRALYNENAERSAPLAIKQIVMRALATLAEDAASRMLSVYPAAYTESEIRQHGQRSLVLADMVAERLERQTMMFADTTDGITQFPEGEQ